jgi:hypothetical protein
MVGGIHTLVEKGNEMGYPHSECAPAQGIRTLFYMLCYVDEVVNIQYRKGKERGGAKGQEILLTASNGACWAARK